MLPFTDKEKGMHALSGATSGTALYAVPDGLYEVLSKVYNIDVSGYITRSVLIKKGTDLQKYLVAKRI